ncbi:MAG TPA: hypothetical protein VMF55_16305 [Solirubrobacterales bacterium]|nr:hypothetical protein [Solirubrobacterales bacterium]
MTSTNPQSAPTNGRVSNVDPITLAPAMPTMITHLKTAASLNFIAPGSPLLRPQDQAPKTWRR